MFVFQVNFSNSFLKGISPQFLFRCESLRKRETEILGIWLLGEIMCYPGGCTSLQEANLVSAIPAVNSSFRSLLTCNNNTAHSITLKPTTVRELENICSTSASGKAPSYDNIPMHVIKNSFHPISTSLMNIINLSFVNGIFPDKTENC